MKNIIGKEEGGGTKKRVLRKMFGPKGEEALEGLSGLMIFVPRYIRAIKSRKMGWSGESGMCVGRRDIHTKFWQGNLKERDYLTGLDVK
jgi:hypothetical protein